MPTTAHTIWGVITGQLLMGGREDRDKLKMMIISGGTLLIVGHALDALTPIIKRISTTSFVLASGGWILLSLAFCYWLIDVKKNNKRILAFEVVGMNSLFIYLFSHVGGADLVFRVVKPFSLGIFGWIAIPMAEVMTGMIAWFLLWYMCLWLYRKRIFIKI